MDWINTNGDVLRFDLAAQAPQIMELVVVSIRKVVVKKGQGSALDPQGAAAP